MDFGAAGCDGAVRFFESFLVVADMRIAVLTRLLSTPTAEMKRESNGRGDHERAGALGATRAAEPLDYFSSSIGAYFAVPARSVPPL